MLIEQGTPVELLLERDGGVRFGDVVEARLVRKLSGNRAIANDEQGRDYLVDKLAKDMTEGGSVMIEVRREAVAEQGRLKWPLGVPTELSRRCGPSLHDRLSQSGLPVETLHPAGVDKLAQHGWDELIEAASSGEWAFDGGSLIISLTPAMTVIDVDGDVPPRALALAAAPQIARVIRLFGLSGNIGIDFPTLEAKADRTRLLEAFDDAASFRCERTAPNGFGFMQVVRRRERPSLIDTLARSPVRSAALAALRVAERSRGTGQLLLRCHTDVAAWLEKDTSLITLLCRALGRPVVIEPMDACALDAFDIVNESEGHG